MLSAWSFTEKLSYCINDTKQWKGETYCALAERQRQRGVSVHHLVFLDISLSFMVMRVLVKLSVVVKLSARTLGDVVSPLLRLPAYSAGLKVSLQWFPHFARPPPSSLRLHYCSTAARLPAANHPHLHPHCIVGAELKQRAVGPKPVLVF